MLIVVSLPLRKQFGLLPENNDIRQGNAKDERAAPGRHPYIHVITLAGMHAVFHDKDLIAEEGGYLEPGPEGEQVRRHDAISHELP